MHRSKVVVCLLVFAAMSLGSIAPSAAHVPNYSNFQLQARSNLCANEPQGFHLPCNVFFNSSTPAINNPGQVVIKLDVIATSGRQGVWMGVNGAGSIVYQSPVEAIVSDPTLNNLGYAVFPQTFSSQNGIYFYDSVTQTSGLRTSLPMGTNAWGSPTVNDLGQVGFRSTFTNGQALYSLDGPSSLFLHAAEAGLDASSPFSFIFSPAFNNNRQIAAHVRLGAAGQVGNSQPDEIRLFNPDGSWPIIARDADALPGSPFSAFDSSRPAVNATGQVAFIANLVGGGRGVFVGGVNSASVPIATTIMPEINIIDFFPPAMNDHGLVAFRGVDGNGKAAIFVGDGKTLRRIIGQFDFIQTDRGLAQIAQHDNSPVFGGSIGINHRGDVVFQCALTPAKNNQIEWGSGLFVAYADINAADINADGFVNVNDLLLVINSWGACPVPPQACPADISPPSSGDGFVNVNDLLLVINNWG